jgi:hypothetical protein
MPWFSEQCTVGSSDFGTLPYVLQTLLNCEKNLLRSNYATHFSSFSAISCENGVFGPKKEGVRYIRSDIFSSWNKSIWVSKDPSFYADFKNIKLP